MKIPKALSPHRCGNVIAAFVTSLVCCASSHGQVVYNTVGDILTQDFNAGLPAPAGVHSWANNEVFQGWYGFSELMENLTEYRISSTGGSGVFLLQLRVNGSDPDGAFGPMVVNDTGAMAIAVQIINNTGSTLTEFHLGYTGEQWRQAVESSLSVRYQIGENIDIFGGTLIPQLTFESIHNGEQTNITGSAAGNYEVFSPVKVTGLNWQHGESLWITWTQPNQTGVDPVLLIDDVVFWAAANPIPEPANMAYMIMAGLLAGFSFVYRRKRKNISSSKVS